MGIDMEDLVKTKEIQKASRLTRHGLSLERAEYLRVREIPHLA